MTLVGELFEIVRATVGIRGVVLNACWSEAQARAILPHVRFVIGMARPIPDSAAIRFAAGLYRGLGFGLGIADAFKLGRNEMAAGAAGMPTAASRRRRVRGRWATEERRRISTPTRRYTTSRSCCWRRGWMAERR